MSFDFAVRDIQGDWERSPVADESRELVLISVKEEQVPGPGATAE